MSKDAAANFDRCQSFSISASKLLHCSVAALSSALNNFLGLSCEVFAECQYKTLLSGLYLKGVNLSPHLSYDLNSLPFPSPLHF